MQESPIFSRTYDFLLWLIPQVNKFPRVHRFGLGERVIKQALSFQESLIAAGLANGSSRTEQLKLGDVQLAQLRQHLRLCKDLELFSMNQYEHLSKMLAEIGRLLGGWIRSIH